jgi:hypothetical protein
VPRLTLVKFFGKVFWHGTSGSRNARRASALLYQGHERIAAAALADFAQPIRSEPAQRKTPHFCGAFFSGFG